MLAWLKVIDVDCKLTVDTARRKGGYLNVLSAGTHAFSESRGHV